MINGLRSIRELLGLTFRAAPLLTAVELTATAAIAVGVPLQTFGLAVMVDTLAVNGSVAAGVLLVAVGLAVVFAGRIASGAVQASMEDKLEAALDRELATLATSIPDIAHHEVPEIADRVTVIREESRDLKYGATSLGGALAVAFGAVTVLGLLVAVHPLLVLLPLLGGLRIWTATCAGRATLEAARSTAVHHRLIDRLTDVARDPKHAIEVRTYGLRGLLQAWFDRLYRSRDEPRWTAARHAAIQDVAGRMAFAVGYGVAVVFVVALAAAGNASPGDVALVVLLVPQVDRAASGLADAARATVRTIGSVDNVRWLRAYAAKRSSSARPGGMPATLQRGIDIVGLSFTYPGGREPALRDVNLFLPAGATVAFVGDNGAGKSTMVKLLARFYDPTVGQIDIDGQDVTDVDSDEWRRSCSAGFQDFVRYEFTAAEAIGIGDLDSMEDETALAAAADRAGATDLLARLPSGGATQLGRRFSNGVDLSGGQWQRLALARAFMRTSPLMLLLDEPTAAIDPEAEHELFNRIAHASQRTRKHSGGITVLVSHRFSTVRMADLIVVFNGGTVTETGSHDALMASGGRYAEMFTLQAKAYR